MGGPSRGTLMRYRQQQWDAAPHFPNEKLDEDPDYTNKYIDDREWRYECIIPGCRNLFDLRMTPSGLICQEHYLPWSGRNSDGHSLDISCCRTPGCLEPPLHKESWCRNCMLPDISDETVVRLAEMLTHLNLENPGLLDSFPAG